MKRWLRSHGQALGDAIDRLVATPLGTLLTVLTLAVAIALPLATGWLVDNLGRLTRGVANSQEITLFFAQDATHSDIQNIERRLKQAGERRVRFVPRDAALADLQKVDGMADLLAGLSRNPLPDALVVQPRDSSPEAMERLVAEARGWPKVAQAQHDSGWARRVESLLSTGDRLVGLLAALLATLVLAVTFNTLRLQIADRREEIEVALLVGATDAWIARPALWFGILQGLLGGVTAVAVVYGMQHWLATPVDALSSLYGSNFRLQPLSNTRATQAVVASITLNLLGAWLAVSWTRHRRD